MSEKDDKAKSELKTTLGKRSRDDDGSEEEMDQNPKKTHSSAKKHKKHSGEVSVKESLILLNSWELQGRKYEKSEAKKKPVKDAKMSEEEEDEDLEDDDYDEENEDEDEYGSENVRTIFLYLLSLGQLHCG